MYYKAKDRSKKQIKIVISGGLGDCLLATPFVRHFKTCGDYDKVVCAVTQDSVELFELNPYIDKLIPCASNELLFWATPEKDSDVFSPYLTVRSPDTIGAQIFINEFSFLPRNIESVPVIKQIAKLHGLQLADETLNIITGNEDERWAEKFMANFGAKPVVLLNGQSQLSEKDLPMHTCKEIEKQLYTDFSVISMASNMLESRNLDSPVKVPGIRCSAALFKRLDCIVSVDSFPAHLAYAVGTPAVVLFGPSNPKAFGHSKNINIRTSQCPPCADRTRLRNCKNPTCVKEIPVDTIVQAVYALVGAERKEPCHDIT